MENPVWFGERLQLETVWVETTLASAAIEQAAVRLRGWALVRGVAITGSPFLSVSPSRVPRVHLPLASRLVPRASTGLSHEAVPGGPIAVIRDVPFPGLLDHVRRLSECLAAFGPSRLVAEYQGNFHGRGLLTIPLDCIPVDPPALLRLEGRPQAPPQTVPLGRRASH